MAGFEPGPAKVATLMGGRVADANAAGSSFKHLDLMLTQYSLQLATLPTMAAWRRKVRGRTNGNFWLGRRRLFRVRNGMSPFVWTPVPPQAAVERFRPEAHVPRLGL